MHKLNHSGFGVIEGILIIVIAGIIGGVGFYAYTQNKDQQPSDTGHVDIASMKTYTSELQGVSFDYPNDWSLSESEAFPGEKDDNARKAKSVVLKSPNGLVIKYHDWVDGLGGGCDEDSDHAFVDMTTELSTFKGIYLVENEGTLALSDEINKSGDLGSCSEYALVKSPLKIKDVFNRGDDTRIALGTDIQFRAEEYTKPFNEDQKRDLETAREILLSFRLK